MKIASHDVTQQSASILARHEETTTTIRFEKIERPPIVLDIQPRAK